MLKDLGVFGIIVLGSSSVLIVLIIGLALAYNVFIKEDNKKKTQERTETCKNERLDILADYDKVSTKPSDVREGRGL